MAQPPGKRLVTEAAQATALTAIGDALRARSVHTGTQPASTINDLVEAVQDIVGAMMVAGGSLTFAYDEATGKATYTASGADAEAVRDAIGAAVVGTQGVSVAVNDAADTITLGISGLTVSQVTGLQTSLEAITASLAGKVSTTTGVKVEVVDVLPASDPAKAGTLYVVRP